MANKYDATALAANAQQLEALAASARSNMLNQTTEKATRLGAEGERLARQAKAADVQRVDADGLAKRHLEDAAHYDAKANSLEQQAAAAEARHDPRGAHEATELREEAAKQREGGEVARARSAIATEDAKRLADEAATMRVREQAIDSELADMGGRLQVAELAVDNLEWHAEKARSMADTARHADDLRQQAAAATSRGDSAAAATLDQRAATLRDDVDVLAFVRARPPFVLDQKVLSEIGVDLPPGTLDVPMPELIDPSSPMNPLAENATTESDGEAVAAADLSTDEMLGFDMSSVEQQVAAADDSSDVQNDVATADTAVADASFVDPSSTATSLPDPSFTETSFTEASFTDSFTGTTSDQPVFDDPMSDSLGADSDFGGFSFASLDTDVDPSSLDADAGFAEPFA